MATSEAHAPREDEELHEHEDLLIVVSPTSPGWDPEVVDAPADAFESQVKLLQRYFSLILGPSRALRSITNASR